MSQGLCASIRGFYLINCVSCTAVQTNDTDCTQQGEFVKKQFRLQRIVCVRWCVFVFVFVFQQEARKYCDRSGTDGVICFEMIGSSSGMNKPAEWGTA